MHVNDSPDGRIKCQLQTLRHKIDSISEIHFAPTQWKERNHYPVCVHARISFSNSFWYYTVPCVFLLTHTIICQIQYQSRGY